MTDDRTTSEDGRPDAPRRPSLLAQVRLSDGRLAWPVARAAGISEATFRARLKAGLSADDAASRPVPARDPQRARLRRDLRASRFARRRPAVVLPFSEGFDLRSDRYGGVIWSGRDMRLIVSPRGAFYSLQCPTGFRRWGHERSFPTAQALVAWLACAAVDPAPDLVSVAAGLPDDPAASGFVPSVRSIS